MKFNLFRSAPKVEDPLQKAAETIEKTGVGGLTRSNGGKEYLDYARVEARASRKEVESLSGKQFPLLKPLFEELAADVAQVQMSYIEHLKRAESDFSQKLRARLLRIADAMGVKHEDVREMQIRDILPLVTNVLSKNWESFGYAGVDMAKEKLEAAAQKVRMMEPADLQTLLENSGLLVSPQQEEIAKFVKSGELASVHFPQSMEGEDISARRGLVELSYLALSHFSSKIRQVARVADANARSNDKDVSGIDPKLNPEFGSLTDAWINIYTRSTRADASTPEITGLALVAAYIGRDLAAVKRAL